MSNVDYGLLLLVKGKPVALGPKEVKAGINNLKAWSLLNPKSYKLSSPIEIGSINDLEQFIAKQFGIENIEQKIKDALPSELASLVKALSELVLTVESFEVNIPAPATFKIVTGKFEKESDIQDISKTNDDSLTTLLSNATTAVTNGNALDTFDNPFKIPAKANRPKTSYNLGLSLQWKDDPISVIPGSNVLQLQGAYLLITS